MQNNYASCHYVVTTTPTYCTALVDLSRSRSVHAVEHNPCCPDPTVLSASECKAVHYGLCSPLLKLPSFTMPPVTTSSPSSPSSTKGAGQNQVAKDIDSPKSRSSASPTSPRFAASNVSTPSPTSPRSPSALKEPSPFHPLAEATAALKNVEPPSQALAGVGSGPPSSSAMSKVDLEMFDPVELLAADLEGKLEALVSTFVAQDKVRLAARKKGDGPGQIVAGKTSMAAAGKSGASSTRTDGNSYAGNDVHMRPADSDRLATPGHGAKDSKQAKESEKPSQAGASTDGGPKFPGKNHVRQNGEVVDVTSRVSPARDGAKQGLDFLQARTTSPTILSPLKPSPEYQQTGVKAQITMFASKERESSQSPVNSLERRQGKHKPETGTPSFKPGPLSLDELQELLKSTSEPLQEPIHTAVFENTRMPSMSYSGRISPPLIDSLQYSLSSPNHMSQESLPFPHQRSASCPESIYQNVDIYKSQCPSHVKGFGGAEQQQDVHYKVNPSREFVQSPVDYAKSRFQNVQQGIRQEDAKPRPKNGQMVTEAKYKWENPPQQNWSPLGDQQLVSNGDGQGHRRTASMDGLLEGPSPSIPHPKLTNVQKQHIKERSLSPTDRHSHVPIRPFLTKGSVAERVLLFECCPDRALERTSSGAKSKNLLINTWRSGGGDVHNKMQFWEVIGDSDKNHCLGSHHQHGRDKENIDPASLRTSSLKRFASSRTPSAKIPRFYYPDGKPSSPGEVECHLKKVAAVFSGLTEGKASREEFGIITKACGLPLYWKLPLFLAARGDKRNSVSCDVFLEYWRRVVNACHDEASKFVFILTRSSRNYLLPEDFIPLMQDVIDSHPGLTFLKEATEFHSRYIHTVIARIYYCANRSWSGKITVPELRKSNFLQVLSTLEEEEDINQITDYFSYEHFYVIYCKFWELDKDHDLYIDQNDLRHHNGGALSTKIVQRIFSGAVTRGPVQKEGKMSYAEFVWFLISEEDKRHPRSIEYWFRCMDLDGDGYLSMYELEYFYHEQLQRLEALGIETLPFNDCLCQMLDIIKPKVPGKISLSDLKKCKMTPIFFDTFFNLEKYLDHEQRDPFASQREHDGEGPELCDWDRYAADEYELLVAEEGAAEQQDELMCLEKDFSGEKTSSENVKKSGYVKTKRSSDEEEYDYADTDVDYRF